MKLVLLGMAMMGTATYNSTDLFAKAQDATGGVVAVYATAGKIDHFSDMSTRAKQQDKLFAVSAKMEPFAREYGQAEPERISYLSR